MNAIKRNLLPCISGFIVAVILCGCGAALGGSVLPVRTLIPSFICLALVLLMALLSYKRISKFEIKDFASWHDDLIEDRDRAEADFEKFQRECAGVYRRFLIQILSSYLLISLMLVFAAAAGAGGSEPAVVSVLFYLAGFYSFWGLFAWLRKNVSYDINDLEDVLDPEDYPAFAAAVRSVFDDEEQEPVMISDGPEYNNIGVGKINDRVVISMGCFPAALLSEEEFRQILLHEKGHYITLPDDPQIRSFLLVQEHDMPSGCSVILTPVDYLFAHLVTLDILMTRYSIIANRKKERMADEYAREHGEPEANISGLAKMDMFDLFLNDSDDYRYSPYSGEKCFPYFIESELHAFARAFADKKDLWTGILENQLPPLMDSHPSFPERFEAMGRPVYDVKIPPMWNGLDCTSPEGRAQLIALAENDMQDVSLTEFQQEQLKLIRRHDKELAETVEPMYAEQREENWTKPFEIIRKFVNDRNEGKKYSVLEMRPVIDACSITDNDEAAEMLCRDCISRSVNNSEAAHASWVLGRILLKRYDKEGIAHLYRAAENNNYMEEAFDLIGEFCLRMHLSEELEEYRRRFDQRFQQYIDDDQDEIGILRKKDRLSEENVLSEEQRKANIEFIVNAFGPGLKELYQVHKQITETAFSTSYVIVRQPGYDQTDVKECYNKVFEYLDNQEWQYALFYIESLPGIRTSDLPGRVY